MSVLQVSRRPGSIGACYRKEGICDFTVWAPLVKSVALRITGTDSAIIPMERDERGYWKTSVTDILPGTRYFYRIDDEKDRADPASRLQPQGVHGPSEVIDSGEFVWEDAGWNGLPLQDFIIYELHVGTFTPEGTFASIIPRLDYLKELGITAIELMPIAQFPGNRNWGYDGVYPYAPQNSYGGPGGLQALVNACHRKGLAVILDVVYNHLGPDGNYLNDFGPYFTGKYRTPWGDAVNFDGPYSDEVRSYFINNALHWITEYRIDGLRLDAIDTIYDFRAGHFLAELSESIHDLCAKTGRNISVIAESDLNDVRIINPADKGGFSIDAQWSDDFHHALHALLTKERSGYYADFGSLEHVEKSLTEGFVYSGQYSRYRKRRHGNPSKDNPAHQFIVCSQNHDQIGNRMLGERLSSLVSFEILKLAASWVVLSPFLPLLFMGEEYGETSPFQYFVSHVDEPLIEAIRKGRSEEFAHFFREGIVPDPQDEETFLRSRINPGLRFNGRHKVLFSFYRELLKLRKSVPALSNPSKEGLELTRYDREQALLVQRQFNGNSALICYSFNDKPIVMPVNFQSGKWEKLLDSAALTWGGADEQAPQELNLHGEDCMIPMSPYNVILYILSNEEQR